MYKTSPVQQRLSSAKKSAKLDESTPENTSFCKIRQPPHLLSQIQQRMNVNRVAMPPSTPGHQEED